MAKSETRSDIRSQIASELRKEFVKFLTRDSETTDRRRREFNMAIFDRYQGYAIWTGTDLSMVMEKFDKAVESVTGQKIKQRGR